MNHGRIVLHIFLGEHNFKIAAPSEFSVGRVLDYWEINKDQGTQHNSSCRTFKAHAMAT